MSISNIGIASPGPWKVEESHTTSAHGTRCVAYIVSDKTNIADVCDSYNISSDEALANAQLIAAAPDLYNGCNALLGLIQLVCNRDDMPPEIRKVLQENHRTIEARDACMKAEVQI